MSPSAPKYVAYYRVSTERQGRSGLGLEAQRKTVCDFIALHRGVLVAAFTEVESGRLNSRPQLEAALRRCRQTRATLVVGKLDRLSRNAAFLLSLRDAGVRFVAADMPDMNEAVVGIMAVMAQAERKAISDRTKAALAARRARGLPLGTPRDLSAYQLEASRAGNAAKVAIASKHATDMVDLVEAARNDGATSLRAIAAYLNQHETTTPRGSAWTAAAVQRAMARFEAR